MRTLMLPEAADIETAADEPLRTSDHGGTGRILDRFLLVWALGCHCRHAHPLFHLQALSCA